MAVKYLIGLIVGLICTLFFGLSTGLAVYVYESGNTKSTASFFESCTKNTATDITTCKKVTTTCDDLGKAFDAGKAFSIVSTIIMGVWFIIAIVRFIKPLVYLAIAPLKVLNYILLLVSLVVGVLDWILGFAVVASSFCNTKLIDTNGVSVGPSAPLAFVATVLIVVQFIIECVMEDDSVAEAASSEANAPTASS